MQSPWFRPDIILHERLNGNYNMLAVESKPESATKNESKEDREKIERVVKQRPYRYELGCILQFLNGPKRHQAGVKVQYYTEGSEWSDPVIFTEEFSGELRALSESRKR